MSDAPKWAAPQRRPWRPTAAARQRERGPAVSAGPLLRPAAGPGGCLVAARRLPPLPRRILAAALLRLHAALLFEPALPPAARGGAPARADDG